MAPATAPWPRRARSDSIAVAMRQSLPSRAVLAAVALLLLMMSGHTEPQFPLLTGRVVDEAGILSRETRDRLTAMLAQHEQETRQQVVVVTSPSLGGLAIEEYGYQLGRRWGIGEKGRDTGALLIVAPNERKVRIEVGYGLEDRLTDAVSRTIIEQSILPAFRRGDFNAGVYDGTAAMLRALGGTAASTAAGARRPATPADYDWPDLLALIIMALLLWRAFYWLVASGQPRGGRYYHPGVWIGGVPSGGGFSGGGGGFSGGGGSFGGGGASGGW